MAESSSDALSASYIKNLLAALPAILAETKCPSCNSSDESVYHPIEGMKNVKFCSSCDTLFGIDDTMNVNDLRQLVEAGKLRFKTEDSCACGNDDVDAFLIEKCQQTGKLHIRCMNCNFTKDMEIIPIDIDVMREDNEDRGLCKDIGLLIGEDDASHTRDDQIPHQSYQSLRCKCGNSEDELFEKVFDESGNSLISVRCWLCYCQIKLETIEENYCLIECVNCGNNTEDLFDKALDRDSKIVGISCHVCGTHLQFTEATNRNQQVNTGSYEPTLFVSYKKTKVTSLETLKPGDHVAWERLGGIYSHHGIVVEVKSENELEVIHNTVADDGKTANGGAKCKILKGIVQVDLSKGDLHICNYEPGECLEPDEVIARAESLLGEKNYNLLLNNCEHFATLCKTSRCFSSQATSFADFIRGLGSFVVKAAEEGVLVGITAKLQKRVIECSVKGAIKRFTGNGLAGAVKGIGIGGNVLINLALEGTAFGIKTKNAYKEYKNGEINKKEFLAKTANAGCSSGIRFACSSTGGVIGQFLIPVPFLGGLVGCTIGSLVGHFIGKAAGKPCAEAILKK